MNQFRDYRIYTHKFINQFQSAHGRWTERKSIVLRQADGKGRVSYGEVCPTPGFVDYSLGDLLPLVQNWKLGQNFGGNTLMNSAVTCLRSQIWKFCDHKNLSSKVNSAQIFKSNLCLNENRVYKKKIGIDSADAEIEEVSKLFNCISADSKVRLDANESLSRIEILKWNEAFKNEPRLQFLEQPLPANNIKQLFELDRELDIPLALDESLIWKGDLNFFKKNKWRGYFVIKPFLLSDWSKTIDFVNSHPSRTVISTVFESPFGFEAVCRCAAYSSEIAGLDRSLFRQNKLEFSEHHNLSIHPGNVTIASLDKLWERL